MRFALADPPYPGQSAKHYADHPDFAGEVDHRRLAQQLTEYDGWALHTSAPALKLVMDCLEETGECPMDPKTFKGGTYRVMAWVKSFAAYKRNVSWAYAWEPVLVKPLRKPVTNRIEDLDYRDFVIEDPATPERALHDAIEARRFDVVVQIASELRTPSPEVIVEPITMKRGLTGAKPERVCHWVFEGAGLDPQDELHDLFPGSGAVTRAWESWMATPSLLERGGVGA